METSLKAAIETKPQTHVAETASAVLQDFVGGMYGEVKNSPVKLISEGVIGAALSAGVAASPLSTSWKTAIQCAGAALLVRDSAVGIKHLADETSIINNSDGTKTAAEISAAHARISEMGAYAANFGATAAGSMMMNETARVAFSVGSPTPFGEGLSIKPAFYDAELQMSLRNQFNSNPAYDLKHQYSYREQLVNPTHID